MTQLTGQFPQNTYGDLLTTTNAGLGLSNTLQPLQDGLGHSSSIQLALNATRFSNMMAIPVWTTATRPAAPILGSMGLNTDEGQIEIWGGATWIPFITSALNPFLAKSWGYVNPDGSLAGSAGVLSTSLSGGNVYSVQFQNRLSDQNYSIVHALSFTSGNNIVRQFNVQEQNQNSFRFEIVDLAGARQTDTYIYFAVFATAFD